MQKLKSLLLILIALVVVVACSSEEPPTATPMPTVASAEPTATTAAQEAPESPLAAPESPLNAPESPLAEPAAAESSAQPETSATTGALVGKLLISSEKYPMLPVSGVRVALAEVVQPDEGPPRATGYDPNSSPFAMSDAEGNFAIGNVKPGLYGIIVDSTITAVMLSNPETEESIIVEIKADEVVDVGTLQYENLPIPGYN